MFPDCRKWREINPWHEKKFKRYPIGYFHIDITEVRTVEGKLNLFTAIDRTSKFVYVERKARARSPISGEPTQNGPLSHSYYSDR
ncbi:transposase [Photorhabdus temperata subsp. temperata M1021]|nr:transposase [Photorhabdus temperata subsp. temperata M1021]